MNFLKIFFPISFNSRHGARVYGFVVLAIKEVIIMRGEPGVAK